jgi:RND family efflux transporter MFP subunit
MKSMKGLLSRKWLLYVLVLGICIIVFPQCGRKEESTAGSNGNASDIAFTVRTAAAEISTITEYLTYSGIVKSARTQVIIPEVAGRIIRLHKEAGDRVVRGDLLLELEDTLSGAQYNQASAALASAKLTFADAEKNWRRIQNLFAKNAVSTTQVEQAESAYKIAKNGLEQAEALYKMADFQFKSAKVYAPVPGVITARNNETGDYINPAMGAFGPNSGVYILEDYSTIYVDMDVPNSEIERIKKGQKADVTGDKASITGKVTSVNEKADPLSLNVLVRIQASNTAGLILPATVVSVRIHFQEKENTIVVPASALVEGNRIFTVTGNRAAEKKVAIGLVNPEMVEVLSGVQAGEKVVVEGNFGLYTGAAVREEGK